MATSRESTISFSAPDRRELIEGLCIALDDALAVHDGVEEGGELIPWQATAESISDLARDIVRLVLDTLDDEGAQLGSLELGGFLETDQGPRAWGTVALRHGEERESARIDIESISVKESDTGWRFEARVVNAVADREGEHA